MWVPFASITQSKSATLVVFNVCEGKGKTEKIMQIVKYADFFFFTPSLSCYYYFKSFLACVWEGIKLDPRKHLLLSYGHRFFSVFKMVHLEHCNGTFCFWWGESEKKNRNNREVLYSLRSCFSRLGMRELGYFMT